MGTPKRCKRLRRWLSLAAALAIAPTSAAEVEGPFEAREIRVPGRPAAALAPASPGPAGSAPQELWVASVSGEPPDEERRLLVFRSAPGQAIAMHAAARLDVPAEVVGFDVAELDPAPGLEVLLVTAGELRVVTPGVPQPLRVLRLDPALPLPAPARGLSHLACVGDWAGDGRLRALLPDVGGARLVALDDGGATPLALPLRAEYETREAGPPVVDEILVARLAWPTLMQADDDGDGRLDLYALSRFALTVHRAGPGGLPSAPTRSLRLRAFTLTEELRHEATSLRLFARDLDHDGLADLVVHRNAGTLLRSHAATDVHRNRGSGIELHEPPDLRLVVENGVSTLDLQDLDADGVPELLETRLALGIVQLVRVLTTRRVELGLRVLRLARPGLSAARPTWSGGITLPLDFTQGRIDGLAPTVAGDWNGDGRRDLLYGPAAGELAIQLGIAAEAGPGFGPRVATQQVPTAGQALVADLDANGLDDLVLYDPRDATGTLRVLRNRGVLPGTAVQLRAQP